jgi:hypothetical protein
MDEFWKDIYNMCSSVKNKLFRKNVPSWEVFMDDVTHLGRGSLNICDSVIKDVSNIFNFIVIEKGVRQCSLQCTGTIV